MRNHLGDRLPTFRLEVPPVPGHPGDVDSIGDQERARLSREIGSLSFELDKHGRELLRWHACPGNVPEPRATLRRMTTLVGERRLLGPQDAERWLSLASPTPLLRTNDVSRKTQMSRRFEGNERAEIPNLLNTNRWNVCATARDLGISCCALRARMRQLGLHGSARRRD